MLTTIREKTQGWITALILGLLAIPFALWGVDSYFDGGQLNVASVDGHDISVDAYRRNLDDERRRVADPKLFDVPEMRQQVVEKLIHDYLAAKNAQSAGYRISDQELARQVRQLPWFQRDGKFDPKLYEVVVRNQGQTRSGFEQSLRQGYLTDQARSLYAQTAIVTDSDISTLLRHEGQQREVDVAVVSVAKLRDGVKITAADIEQDYQRNPDRFRTTEKIRIDYVQISAADLAKSVRLTDEELRQAQNETAQASRGGQERRASHILLELPAGADAAVENAAMAQAQDLRAKLLAGADFAALAKQHSKDPGSAGQGGDLGVVTAGVMVKEFEQALFALKKPGDLSVPVRTSFGVHLIKLTSLQGPVAGAAPDRAKFEAGLKARKAEEQFIDLSERLRNLAYEQPDSLKPAAEALGLKVETSPWLTRAGTAEGLLSNRKVVDAAFDPEVLEQRRNSSALEIGNNSLVVLRIHAHEAPRQLPLTEVRAVIEQSLLQAARAAEAERITTSALQQLREGKTLDSVIRQFGLVHTGVRVVGRKSKEMDAALIGSIFEAPAPANDKPVYGLASLTDGARAVFVVRKVKEPAAVAMNSPEAAAARRVLESRRGREHYEGYRAALRQQATIKIYKDQL